MDITHALLLQIRGEVLKEISQKAEISEKSAKKICEYGIPLLLSQISRNVQSENGYFKIQEILKGFTDLHPQNTFLGDIFSQPKSAVLLVSKKSKTPENESQRMLEILSGIIFETLSHHIQNTEISGDDDIQRILSGINNDASLLEELIQEEKKASERPDESLRMGMSFLKKVLTKKNNPK